MHNRSVTNGLSVTPSLTASLGIQILFETCLPEEIVTLDSRFRSAWRHQRNREAKAKAAKEQTASDEEEEELINQAAPQAATDPDIQGKVLGQNRLTSVISDVPLI